ncbi:ABC transporter ATP-binding protein [Companilactobacillus sp.]|jgi:ATP-binding cassette subfamily B protein|uniref:ABC transporter ATP-binding protein n=1 Tax=Companilactobacillus sp. TaxID=2767905 RepID=UPI0025B9874D|nr:ABC transporter transmembrane domain-containing protein [Companilactobacillus sp.]MCH4009234.1 ATP-binding cassette domain-containing protein [Companilactobacillus sp.]MCH4050587.1 ATP-binding cassette domain-containing protein [Companilactobacillus sp.]MCH4077176.1 ATP-binding cassette domain-containing protein [Companilactobacillus sp.]MCH4125752.1 ATP-binding cassette domain-containing protein [Companilactobacillus sp.]MCI1311461.1 ABC transporter transmembrane domain-containing protein 
MGIFKRLGWFFTRRWRQYSFGVLALLLVAACNVIPPRIVGNVVDAVNKHSVNSSFLLTNMFVLLFVAIAGYLLRFVWQKMIFGSSYVLERDLRSRLFNHFMKMDTTFYQKWRTGDLMAHATNDIDAVREVAGPGVLTLADSLITGLSMVFAMGMFVSWKLTLIAIIPLLLLAVMANVLGNKIHNAFLKSQGEFSNINNKTQESVVGIKVLKALGQEHEDEQDFNQYVDNNIKANKRSYRLDAMFNPLTTLIMGLSYVVTIVIGGLAVIHNSMTIGQLVSFITYLAELTWPMFAIGSLFNILERGAASYDRITELLDEKSSLVVTPNALTTIPNGDIDFDMKTFHYPDDKAMALTNVSFSLKEGQTLGIVGPTGGGKSTIIRLLLRDFDHYNGQINLGQNDIRAYDLEKYLDKIGYVPQTNFLFSTDIRDNIRFANIDADDKQVKNAAHIADLDEDIELMPEKYDTQVGELGVSLSGGQKQRMAIARAILSDPKLLILDDSLSAVDAKTERNIEQRIAKERCNGTTIIAASRLSSVENADEIIVVDHGTIIEQGTHKELLAKHGWYDDTFNLQAKSAEIEGRLNQHG